MQIFGLKNNIFTIKMQLKQRGLSIFQVGNVPKNEELHNNYELLLLR